MKTQNFLLVFLFVLFAKSPLQAQVEIKGAASPNLREQTSEVIEHDGLNKIKTNQDDWDKLPGVGVQNRTKTASYPTITYSLINPQITFAAGSDYFEFDLALSDNTDSIYFIGGNPVIFYDTLIFGAGVNITVTRSTVLQDTSTYWNPAAVFLAQHDIVEIVMVSHVPGSAVSYCPLTATPTEAVHVKMKIRNCNFQGIVNVISSALNRYGDDPTNPTVPTGLYNQVTFGNDLVFTGCVANGISESGRQSINRLLYPNPSTGYINLSFITADAGMMEFDIYDFTGRTVFIHNAQKIIPGAYDEKINIDALPDGFYLARLRLNNFEYAEKFIKQ